MITDLSLDIGGSEWVILILLGLFLLFGSKKLPQVSRGLGKIIGEYQRAKNEIQEEITRASRIANNPIKLDGTTNTTKADGNSNATKADEFTNTIKTDENSNATINSPVASEREKLEIIAKTLEIEPRGKSTEELRQLISNKMNQ